MPVNNAYLSAIAAANPITHIGLTNAGVELSGGTYARKAVTWTDTNGSSRISADQTFDIPAGATVDGWKGFSALTLGTDYGGGALTAEAYASAGTYTLQAANTGINHTAA